MQASEPHGAPVSEGARRMHEGSGVRILDLWPTTIRDPESVVGLAGLAALVLDLSTTVYNIIAFRSYHIS